MVALAQPSIPATFYGSVTVDGRPAESGVDVRAFVGGIDCTQASPGARPVLRDGDTSAYVLHVVHDSQRAGCAREGATVTFTIAGIAAVQQSQWKPGPIRLDLSTGAASPIPLPSATGTLAAVITQAVDGTIVPGTNTPLPQPPGPPPTDDVDIPGITGTRTPAPSAPATGDSDGGASWPLLVGGLAVLLAGAGALVYVFHRRRTATRTNGA